ncbi:MAG: hypothetical protein VB032_03045 [Burkholderiaceae bacterium]|nr:hypothetical protein [Burkholderiaceae bacterium]
MNTITPVAAEQIIEALVATYDIGNKDIRAKHLFRESLHNLVRLAKAELLLEMRKDVAKVTCPMRGVASSAFTTREQ